MTEELLEIPHIGEFIKGELLEEHEVSVYKIAKDTEIPYMTLKGVVDGNRSLSAEVALILGKYFKIDPHFLMNLQTDFQLMAKARELENRLLNIKPLVARPPEVVI